MGSGEAIQGDREAIFRVPFLEENLWENPNSPQIYSNLLLIFSYSLWFFLSFWYSFRLISIDWGVSWLPRLDLLRGRRR